jgi:hypothetical protein
MISTNIAVIKFRGKPYSLIHFPLVRSTNICPYTNTTSRLKVICICTPLEKEVKSNA